MTDMMSTTTKFVRIVNCDGGKVCERATLRACVELLEEYAGQKPGWNHGPYRLQQITERYWRPTKARKAKRSSHHQREEKQEKHG